MPADGRGIKKGFSPEEARDAGSLRVPLIPADQNADVGIAGFPDAESAGALVIPVVCDVRVARSEVELLVEEGIVRDVHLAVRAEESAVGVDHGSGVAIDTGGLALEDWYDNYHLELARQLLHALHCRTIDRLGQIEALVLLGFAEVRRVEQLLEADDLRALLGRFADSGLGTVDVFPDVVGDRFLDDSNGERRRCCHRWNVNPLHQHRKWRGVFLSLRKPPPPGRGKKITTMQKPSTPTAPYGSVWRGP